jgi:osmotically-inducible protein OsmY
MFTTFHKTDAEIESQIREELRWDCRTDGHSIKIDVTDGVVTLSGTVNIYAVKCAAEEAAHRIAGVQGLNNEIVVKIPYLEFKADMEIAAIATQIFAWNVLIPHERVSAHVFNGWVTLVGTVDCWSQREEVQRAVSILAGVRGITNQIRVNAAAVETERVCEAIENTLDRHSPHASKQVHVAMEDGVVRLTGQAPSWGERCVAVNAAGYAPGVRTVIDELKVVCTA